MSRMRLTHAEGIAVADDLARLQEQNQRLRKGIQDYLDGNYGRHIPRKIDKCPHNLFGWEACENCIDEYFTALLKNET